MKPKNSLTDGYRELLFGQWMPHLLLEEYETDRLPVIDQLWNVPDLPELYLNSDKQMFLIRWQDLADSVSGFSEWFHPFFQLVDLSGEPFHPVCRFYNTVLWCENRMIVQVLQKWQEQLELTILKYELVTLQNQLIDYLLECHRRMLNSDAVIKKPNEKLSQYLSSRARDSMIILLLEIDERFGHLLEKRGLNLEEIFIRYLKSAVPSQKRWVSTPSRVKWKLCRMGGSVDTCKNIRKLLVELKDEFNQLSEPGKQQTLLPSIHILEDAWFCQLALSDFRSKPLDISNSELCRDRILQWKSLFLSASSEISTNDGQAHQKVFYKIVRHLAEILKVLETDREPFSEAAELAILIKELFSEEIEQTLSASGFLGKNAKPGSGGHWLLDQYIPLEMIRLKLEVSKRTMRTYISDYDLPVSEITAKCKWVKTDDFEIFMDRFKNKGTGE